MSAQRGPFTLRGRGIEKTIGRWLVPAAEKALAMKGLNALYRRIMSIDGPETFIQKAIRALDVTLDVDDADVASIPATGPLILVANHPFGALDGLALASLVQRVRPDVKLMVNYLLKAVPDMAASCIFVDPFGGPAATRNNVAAMKQALAFVREGGALIIFPAGEVSSWKPGKGVAEADWSGTIGRFVLKAQAPVVPVFFRGRNSVIFHGAGLIHPRLRTVLLPRELLKKQGSTVQMVLGRPIPFRRLAKFESQELTSYLRVRSALLSGRDEGQASGSTLSAGKPRIDEPVAQPCDGQLLAAEVAALPAECRLVDMGNLSVLLATAQQVPQCLREIGRLREIAFRQIGEGTGRPLDLDRFDEHYQHLFVWDHTKSEIVGAYRLGMVDEIVDRMGPSGLYTSTLFNFRPELLEQMRDSMELGRSFVRVERQREPAALMLLWKGIGQVVVREPRYARLFGPVSISNDFCSMTRWLLMEFLRHNKSLPTIEKLVLPQNPPQLAMPRGIASMWSSTIVHDMDQVGDMVEDIESGRRAVPVLLRQYLKLNAGLMGFNVDPDFGDVLDALMLIDLRIVDPQILGRYLGRESSREFLARHGVHVPAAETKGAEV
jgi:putative hemolysin